MSGEDEAKRIATENEILRCVVGSQLHGLNVPGQDDLDLMGVAIEPPETTVGLGQFDHWQYRTAAEGQRSGPGDIDLTIYSLRKYVGLAVKGNPTILLPLFAPDDKLTVRTPWGLRLREMAPDIVSRQAGRRFLGYLDAQLERVQGRGKRNRVPKRPELIAAHGYDVKFAAHALRLGLQGLELMATGRVELPMSETQRSLCLTVRKGELRYENAVTWITEVRAALTRALDNGDSPLPERPNLESIQDFLIDAHRSYWRERL